MRTELAAMRRVPREQFVAVSLRRDACCGDGSVGWPKAAPFKAISVAAGGPAIPVALDEQLTDGGRLVMPVGDSRTSRNWSR